MASRTELQVGDGNMFREYVTVSRGTVGGGGKTTIGSGNLFLASSHVGHDCHVGDHTIFVNGATLAGHVTVEDFATIGFLRRCTSFAAWALRLHRRVDGDHAGCAAVFAHGDRARDEKLWRQHNWAWSAKDFPRNDARRCKRAFRLLLRSKMNTSQALAEMRKSLGGFRGRQELIRFIETAERGIVK